MSNITDISIHTETPKPVFDAQFPVYFEVDHDYNNMLFFLPLVNSPITSGVEGDSPKNILCFWVFIDLVIAGLGSYLYHATLSFTNCSCKKQLRTLQYVTEAAAEVHKNFPVEMQLRFFTNTSNMPPTQYCIQMQVTVCVQNTQQHVNEQIYYTKIICYNLVTHFMRNLLSKDWE